MKILFIILAIPSALISTILLFYIIFSPGYGGDFIFILFHPPGFLLFVSISGALLLYFILNNKTLVHMGLKIMGVPCLISFLLWSYYTYNYSYKPYRGEKFNQEKWMSNVKDPESRANARCKMYNDIVNNHLKKGMKVQEVEALFGPITEYNYCLKKKVKCINYRLGTCWTHYHSNIDSLKICFNDSQEVIYFSNFSKNWQDKEICEGANGYCKIGEQECSCYFTYKTDGGYNISLEKCPEITRW